MPNDNKCDKCGGFETRNLECPQCEGEGYGALLPERGKAVYHEYKSLDTSRIPTVKLSSREYNHVVSEIATHMPLKQKEEFLVVKYIGDYIYVFENHGFGSYRIIGREPIDDE